MTGQELQERQDWGRARGVMRLGEINTPLELRNSPANAPALTRLGKCSRADMNVQDL